jgi:hypothetical protein
MTYPVNRATFSKILNSEFNFRLNSSYVLNYTLYIKILDALKKAGVVVEKASGLIKVRRERVSEAITTATILIKSLWKASIHPLKLELRTHGSRYQCKELDIIGVATGLGSIGKFSVVPKYLKEIVGKPLATTGDLVILELKPDRSSEDSYYMVTLLNTKLGKLVADMLTYGSTGQLHLDVKHLGRVYIPVIDNYKSVADNMKIAVEEYESKAWRAYFNAMKIVEEYFDIKNLKLTSITSFRIMRLVGRIDATMHILLSDIMLRPSKEGARYLGELYDIISGTAPSSRVYEKPCRGQKYISTKSIDESGYVDDENFYCYPGQLKTRNLAKNGSLVLLKNAHTVEALGKVGIVYPYNDLPAISDLYILNPKNLVDKEISFYITTLLKTKLFKYIMQSLAYGLTAHIRAEDLAKVPIPFINQWKEVAKYMKEFVENMYQANILKKQAVMELENYILKLLS